MNSANSLLAASYCLACNFSPAMRYSVSMISRCTAFHSLWAGCFTRYSRQASIASGYFFCNW